MFNSFFFCDAESLLFNKIDERQRLARERREEREKQNGVYSVCVTDSRDYISVWGGFRCIPHFLFYLSPNISWLNMVGSCGGVPDSLVFT